MIDHCVQQDTRLGRPMYLFWYGINLLHINEAISKSVIHSTYKGGGNKANVWINHTEQLTRLQWSLSCILFFPKVRRANTSHISYICCNELLQLSQCHYPTHTTSHETTNPNHETDSFMFLQHIHYILLTNEYDVTMALSLSNTCSIEWKQGTRWLEILSSWQNTVQLFSSSSEANGIFAYEKEFLYIW